MLISCPGCTTVYDVPNAAFAGRERTLRCQQCHHQWKAAPPAAPTRDDNIPATINPDDNAAATRFGERSDFQATGFEATGFEATGFGASRFEASDYQRASSPPPLSEPAPGAPVWPASPTGAPAANAPAANAPAQDPFSYAGPSSTAEILASLARNANAEPDPNPYAETSNESENTSGGASLPGNEERFAALVKSSRAPTEARQGRAGVFTTFIVLVFVLGGLYVDRAQVMQKIPASTPIFAGFDHLFGSKPQ